MEESNPYKKHPEYEQIIKTPKKILSEEKSTDSDIIITNSLIKDFIVGKFYLYGSTVGPDNSGIHPDESEEKELLERSKTLSDIKAILKRWIVSLAEKKMDFDQAQEEEVRLFPFGSHKLGVNSRGGDIDTVVLCPNYVDRDIDFFGKLYEELVNEPHVTDLVKVNDAKTKVPVLTMMFRGIPIDLGFAKIDAPKIEKTLKDLNDPYLLQNMDEKMVFSVNGPRNVDLILRSLDARDGSPRLENFRTTLKLMKLWAKNRGVYNNSMGYLTGISLAILVAKICQMFPNLMPNQLIEKFFLIYSDWDWEEVPVYIEEISPKPDLEFCNGLQWYDHRTEHYEKYVKKKETPPKMAVATPAFPCMNSTYKINFTTLKIIQQEILRGRTLTQSHPVDWKKLFEKIDIFNDYFNFIEVAIVSHSETEFKNWRGYVESQMIALTSKLEETTIKTYYEYGVEVHVHPYPVGIEAESITDPEYDYYVYYFYGIRAEGDDPNLEIDLFTPVRYFMQRVDQKRKEWLMQTTNVRVLHKLRTELPDKLTSKDPNAIKANPPPVLKNGTTNGNSTNGNGQISHNVNNGGSNGLQTTNLPPKTQSFQSNSSSQSNGYMQRPPMGTVPLTYQNTTNIKRPANQYDSEVSEPSINKVSIAIEEKNGNQNFNVRPVEIQNKPNTIPPPLKLSGPPPNFIGEKTPLNDSKLPNAPPVLNGNKIGGDVKMPPVIIKPKIELKNKAPMPVVKTDDGDLDDIL